VKGIIGVEEISQSTARLLSLTMSFGSKFHSMVGSGLVDIAVFISF
jgi:hypothetical protein